MKEKLAPYVMGLIIFLFCVFYAIFKCPLGGVDKYVIVGISLWMVALYFLFISNVKKKASFEKLSIILILGIGALYFVFMPRFSVPDEDGHFKRSYEISIGNFLSENHGDGGFSLIPGGFAKEQESVELLKDYLNPKDNVYNLQKQYSHNKITDELFESYNPNQALYSPFAYIPQSLGISVARIFTKNAAVLFYAGRLAMFAFSLVLIYYSIKLIPTGKRTILIMCLFPMFMQEMISYSCDALINTSSVFLIAYILHVCEKKQVMTPKDKLIIGFTCFIIAMCKIVYLPLVLAVFIIPKEKFKDKKAAWLYKILTAGISVVSNLVWLLISSSYMVETNPGVSPFEQVKYVITNPFSFMATIFRTIAAKGAMWAVTMAGCRLGSLCVNVSYVAIVCILLILVFDFFIRTKEEKYIVSKMGKILICLVLFSILMLTFASLYVQWTPYMKKIIDGVQGRYFIPFICWFVLVIGKIKVNIDNVSLAKIYLPVLIMVNYCAIFSIYTHFLGIV